MRGDGAGGARSATADSLYAADLYQIWRFENLPEAVDPDKGQDACEIPQMSWVTGDIDVHDMVVDDEGLLFVNTLFSCLARPSAHASFKPVWQPPFISEKLAAEDRCHLNGLALAEDGANGSRRFPRPMRRMAGAAIAKAAAFW